MKPPTLFNTDNLFHPKDEIPKKYKSKKSAKQRYNLTQQVRKKGVSVDAKDRSFDVNTTKHADPLTRRRINKLIKKHSFGGEYKLNFTR